MPQISAAPGFFKESETVSGRASCGPPAVRRRHCRRHGCCCGSGSRCGRGCGCGSGSRCGSRSAGGLHLRLRLHHAGCWTAAAGNRIENASESTTAHGCENANENEKGFGAACGPGCGSGRDPGSGSENGTGLACLPRNPRCGRDRYGGRSRGRHRGRSHHLDRRRQYLSSHPVFCASPWQT